jgi:hypothetical protein
VAATSMATTRAPAGMERGGNGGGRDAAEGRGLGREAYPGSRAHAVRPLPELLALWLLVAMVILALVPRVVVPADSNTGDNTCGAALV